MQQYCNTAQQMSNLRLANNEHQELRCSLRSSLKGEPNGREGVRKTAMESLPEGRAEKERTSQTSAVKPEG